MRKEHYIKELENLKTLKGQVQQSLQNAPAGRIRAEMSKGKYPQYYYYSEDIPNSKGRYLKKSEIGKKLFVTFESSLKPINMKTIDRIVKKCLR